MFCFDNAFPEKSCFVVDLVFCFVLPTRFVLLNATAREWNLPQQLKCFFFQFPRSPLKRRQGVLDRRRNARTQTSVKVHVGIDLRKCVSNRV